ncbi:hypothetical protein [Spartinivicinus poritis]|uniref:Methyltransferase type 11 domain-containing protein n=1 Tax=Spartinivicinus poritis TaxID=2994640 RepID=A0ABT5U7C7_9GAMM|nr:hypothetical protein [Spartinivicinus sp. A2-2]MDE1462276.1 hypothetical protein [Spartinivicinus sp. A2-2]
MNFAQYNYYIWLDQICSWFGADNKQINKALDIGSGNGAFLSGLVQKGLIEHGYGVDMKTVTPQYESLKYFSRDLTSPSFSEGIPVCEVVFFMNMFHLLSDITEVQKYLGACDSENLIMAIPTKPALDMFENRHPNINSPDRDVNEFLETTGYGVYKSCELVSHYYLKNPLKVLIGGKAEFLAKKIEGMSKKKYYILIWSKKST